MADEPIINHYLRQMLELGGSDLHLSINFPAKARIHDARDECGQNECCDNARNDSSSFVYGERERKSVICPNVRLY